MQRRDFLKLSLQATTLGLVAGQLASCEDMNVDDLGYQGDYPFLHGVASGDPLPNQVILWTRVTQDDSLNAKVIPVGYAVATDPEFKHIVTSGKTQTSAARDYTVKVDVNLPKDNTTYYYAFQALGHTSPLGRTRTAPRADADIERARFAVCSCSNFGFGYFNAYAHIAARQDLTAVIHLGDYIYEHQEGFYCDPFLLAQRPLDPKHEIVTLDDYRRRYACYHRDPDLQECHRQHPWITVWDDHEIANDTWKNGAQNHQRSEGDFEKRKLAAVQAYREWLPIRDNKDSTLDADLRIYRKFSFGRLFDLTMLDTRIFGRDKQDMTAANDPQRSLLGLEQENWLNLNMMASKQRGAQWQLIGQQVILSPFKGSSATFNGDLWNGYVTSRQRFLDFIERNQLDNTVILTGDYHASFAFDVCKDPFDASRYNPKTGEGAIAVEYVCPAVTSGTFPEIAGAILNPHQKFNDQFNHGYMLIDVDKQRCQCEWYFTRSLYNRNTDLYLAKVLATHTKTNHLVSTQVSTPIANAAALVPDIRIVNR